MVMVTARFEHVAEEVTGRTAELLGAPVAVTDERGVVIASSERRTVGLPWHLVATGQKSTCVRVPIRLDAQAGEVIVAEPPASGEAISPRLTQALVELVVNQTAVVARLPNQHELKNKFIHDLLRGPIGDEASILREGQILGMDLTRPRAVILIDAAAYILAPAASGRPGQAEGSAPGRTDAPGPLRNGEARIRRRAQLVIARVVGFFALPNDTICAYIGDGEVAVLKASSTQDLVAWADGEGGPDQASPSWANMAALKRAGAALLTRL